MCIIWLFGLKSNCDMYLSSSWGMIVKKKNEKYIFLILNVWIKIICGIILLGFILWIFLI